MANVDATSGVRFDRTDTYKIADSQSLTTMDPVYLSSGKVAVSTDTLATNIIGFAVETKSMGVLATVGQQEYIGIRRKGRMSFTGLKDSGSYTEDIAIGDKVSLYYDGSDYYVVKNNTNPLGEVVEGSMDTVGSSTTILVEVDLTAESVRAGEIGFPMTVPTDSKLQFRDTGLFMHSSADGKLLISSDGSGADDITLTGNVTISNDLVVVGTFSGTSEGKTFTGTVQLNDQAALQFEGLPGDDDGLSITCSAAGDSLVDCTAGLLEFNSKDAVFTFQDSDDGNDSDYLDIRVADAGGVVKFEGEPGGEFRFLDANAGTPSTTDYLQFTVVEGGSRVIFAAEPAGAFRFKDAGDSNNSDVLDLDLTDAGGANVMTSAVAFEIATTAGNIVLDSAGDIALEAAGADITMDAQLTITNTSADQFIVAYDGSNYFGFDIDIDGSTTLTTTGTNADFEIATGTTGDIVLDSSAGIDLEPTSDVTITLPAAAFVSIDAGTTDSTASDVLRMDVDVNSTNCNAIGIDLDVGTALSAAEIVNGVSINIDGDGADDGTAEMRGIFLTSANTTTGINEGISFGGTWDTAIEINATVGIGINIVGTPSIALAIGAGVTPFDITGAQTQIFDFTGVTTAVVEDSKAYPDKAGSIKIITPAGAAGYINYYDGTPA